MVTPSMANKHSISKDVVRLLLYGWPTKPSILIGEVYMFGES